MAVPKRRTSKMRKNKRRSHHGLKAAGTVECTQCKQDKLLHRVCPHCGFYKGKEVVAIQKG